MELGIYIHVPFCIKKCDYCDFISYSNKYNIQEEYIEKLIKEIEDNKEILEKNNITTIYFGGGTPSSIKPELIGQVLNKIYEIANIKEADKEKIEITLEVNPGTASKSNLQLYKNCGINRLSIGLQSTNNEILKQIGRIHTYEQFLNTYNWALEAGIKNINVDLMIGLPGKENNAQTIEDIKESLEKITNLKEEPNHISVYSLIIEEGTKIEEKINSGEVKVPEEDLERNQYHYVKNYLELKGYKHYEISNFAKEGKESKHNMNCWMQKQYIGFGVAAHSYINKKRYSNTENIEEYIKNDSKKIKTVQEIQNQEEEIKEYMLLGLRKIEGISILRFEEKFAQNPIYLFRNILNKLVREELLEIDLDKIKLTLKGLDYANLVWEEFV